MMDDLTLGRLTNETVELLQALIRNQCVNDGTPESGQEERSAKLLRDELEGTGVDVETYEPTPGRTSLVARWEGTDPDAPSLCLMGHTDVVPVSAGGWERDPFGGELVPGDSPGEAEVWGRGAVDMLNLTASMAVAFRHMVTSGKRYAGDIIYFAVADEEAGGAHGAELLVRDHWDALQCEFVLTEFGGIPYQSAKGTTLLITTAEKGVAWRRLRVKGTPGHGSRPFKTDNALIKAADIVRRLARYQPAAKLDDLWGSRIEAMGLSEDLSRKLLDPTRLDEALDELPAEVARNAHACCHTTFSPNVIAGGNKTNMIPDEVMIEVDIRTLPGETAEDVNVHLEAALGDALEWVEVEVLQDGVATASPTNNALWEAIVGATKSAYPQAAVIPSIVTGGTDSRFFREAGAVAYGAGLLSSSLDVGEFNRRFHGHNERIDVESLRLTTQLWFDIVDRLWE